MNVISHPYHLDESIYISRGIRSNFFISFFDEIHVSKQNSPRWDAAFCSITSDACPINRMPGSYGFNFEPNCRKSNKVAFDDINDSDQPGHPPV